MDEAQLDGELAARLASANLSQFLAPLEDEGYDLAGLLSCSDPDLEQIADEAGMKKGHKMKFVRAFSSTQTTPLVPPVAPETQPIGLPVPQHMTRDDAEPHRGVSQVSTDAPHVVPARPAADRKISFNVSHREEWANEKGGTLPLYDPDDWEGRMSLAEYKAMEAGFMDATDGEFNNTQCHMTCYGCFLCCICASYEQANWKKSVSAYAESLNETYRGRGMTFLSEWVPIAVFRGGTSVKQLRLTVKFCTAAP